MSEQTTSDSANDLDSPVAEGAAAGLSDAADAGAFTTDDSATDGTRDTEDTDDTEDTEDTEDTDDTDDTEDTEDGLLEDLENQSEIAADYLEELLDIADLDGDLDMDVEGDRASVSIVGGDVRMLVGRNGEVLEALQELTRLAVYRETGERSRLMLDIGGYRADKRSRLEKLAAEAVAEVRESGEPKSLDPMTPFERKVVHDAVAAAGLRSESEGVEPHRHVVVLPV